MAAEKVDFVPITVVQWCARSARDLVPRRRDIFGQRSVANAKREGSGEELPSLTRARKLALRIENLIK